MRPQPVSTLALVLFFLVKVAANTEKVIFLGPDTPSTPRQKASIEALHLDTLTPTQGQCRLRTHLEAAFPTAEHPYGPATWLLLDRLAPGRRYEARVCWTATQPTAFTLTTHQVDAVLADPGLSASLAAHMEMRAGSTAAEKHGQEATRQNDGPALLLRVLAAADYFAANATLMAHVNPVHVDVLLDPFLLNVLPRSLAPTAVYIVAVAIVSYLVARSVATWLSDLAAETAVVDKKKRP